MTATAIRNRIDVWWSRLEEVRDRSLVDLLDEREQARLASLRSSTAAHRFMLGTALARSAVAREAGIAPADVRIDRTCTRCGDLHGPPRVTLDGEGVSLSITHAGALVGVALTRCGAIGVDVEPIARSKGVAEAIHSVLHPAEIRELKRLGAEEALRVWTRKEAIVKALQVGLTVPLTDLRVSTGPTPRVLAWKGFEHVVSRIQLHAVATDPGHLASLAWIAPDGVVASIQAFVQPGASLLDA